jgi:hypothetical protein
MRSKLVKPVSAIILVFLGFASMGRDLTVDVSAPDVSCLVVGASIANSPDEGRRAIGRIILTYYLGRVDALSPGVDLGSAMAKQQLVDETMLKSETARCSKVLLERVKAIQRSADELSRKGL